MDQPFHFSGKIGTAPSNEVLFATSDHDVDDEAERWTRPGMLDRESRLCESGSDVGYVSKLET